MARWRSGAIPSSFASPNGGSKSVLKCAGGTLPQFLKWRSLAIRAVEKIYRSLTPSLAGPPNASDGALLPILNPYNPEGTTKYVDFSTSKTTLFATRPDKCHLNYVVYDKDWEVGLAERLEEHARSRRLREEPQHQFRSPV